MASLSRGPLSKGICYAFKNGECKRGDKCNYIHEREGMDSSRPQTMEELVAPRRSRLNFVTRAVMSSSGDGTGYDKEEAVAPKPGEDAEDGATVERFGERDLRKLEAREKGEGGGGDGSKSLYDQLQANKERKEAEWAEAHPEFAAPRGLDDEEAAFLDEQADRQREEDERALDRDAREVAAFAIARASTVYKHSTAQRAEQGVGATVAAADGGDARGAGGSVAAPSRSAPSSKQQLGGIALPTKSGKKKGGALGLGGLSSVVVVKKRKKKPKQEGDGVAKDSRGQKKKKTKKHATNKARAAPAPSVATASAPSLLGGLVDYGSDTDD